VATTTASSVSTCQVPDDKVARVGAERLATKERTRSELARAATMVSSTEPFGKVVSHADHLAPFIGPQISDGRTRAMSSVVSGAAAATPPGPEPLRGRQDDLCGQAVASRDIAVVVCQLPDRRHDRWPTAVSSLLASTTTKLPAPDVGTESHQPAWYW
jgi:hypothetical protein